MTTTPSASLGGSATEVLAATIAAAVERQLTQYMGVVGQQVDAARAEMATHRDAVTAQLQQQAAADATWRNAVEQRLQELSASVSGGVDAGEIAGLRDHLDAQVAATQARVDEIHKAQRRFDDQSSALVQHVNETTIALSTRMDEGNQSLAAAVDERLTALRAAVDGVLPEVNRRLDDHGTQIVHRIEYTENKVTDRMLAMESRINEDHGTKLANLEATLGRIGAGFDEAIGAISHRMLGVENGLAETGDMVAGLQEQVAKVSAEAIDELRQQLSSAIGEAMLVRIELDRAQATTNERLDLTAVRMAEIEAQLADEMDVSTAVQLERLEEIERALIALDPDQFVRRTDPAAMTERPTPPTPPTTPLPPTTLPTLATLPTLTAR